MALFCIAVLCALYSNNDSAIMYFREESMPAVDKSAASETGAVGEESSEVAAPSAGTTIDSTDELDSLLQSSDPVGRK